MARRTSSIILIPLFVFLWEHIALTNNIKVKPSIFIDGLTFLSEAMWEVVGISFAYLGTYYEYLHLDRCHLTFKSLCSSLDGLFNSIKYFELGFNSVAELYDHPYMVYVSAILTLFLIITSLLWFKFTCHVFSHK